MGHKYEGGSYQITCLVKHETDNAMLIYDYAHEEEFWIPLSQIHEIHRLGNDQATIVMTSWIARQKGLL